MTCKDYVALAEALKRAQPPFADGHSLCQWRDDVRAVAMVLAWDNPRFTLDRFLVACGCKKVESC
jgi:hypothetical protein